MSEPASTPAPRAGLPWFCVAIFFAVLTGVLLRTMPTAKVAGIGFDEVLYHGYVQKLEATGLFDFDRVTQVYLEDQRKPAAKCALPPTRFLYTFCGYVWKTALHGDEKALNPNAPGAVWADPYLRSLRAVSKTFSVLAMLVAGAFAYRLAGRAAGLAVLALMACAPLQILMTQHAMIDGFFTFWALLALWTLWECLQACTCPRRLIPYGLALFCMVLTKENAFFVYVALVGLLVLNHWMRWGKAGRALWAVTFLAPLAAVLVLVFLAGGVSPFIETYKLLVNNAQHNQYSIETGDGPWHRYLVDLMVMSPVILCLAIAAAFHTWREEKWVAWVLGFVVITYVIMCNVKYGMNLRYATIWDAPLCLLAYAQLARSARGAGQFAKYLLPTLVGLLCIHELLQYKTFFHDAGLYELGPADMLNAVKILK